MLQKTTKLPLFVRKPFLVVYFAFILSCLSAVAIFAISPPADASSPTLNFQARLLTSSGAIVPDGNYNVEFKIYSGSSCIPSTGSGCTTDWTEDYFGGSTDNRLRVADGYLTANLGSLTPFNTNIPWGQPLWLSLNVGGTINTGSPTMDGAMFPYLTLTSVPAALSLNYTDGTHTGSLAFTSSLSGNDTITLPDASGTVCLATSSGGNCSAAGTGYILNQSSAPGSAQTGNFNITGTGIAGALQSGTLDTESAGILSVGTSTATGITLGNTSETSATTITGGNGGVIIQGGSGDAVSIGNQSGTTVNSLTIGNASASDVIALQTASTVAITSSNFRLSTAGVVTLVGGQAADITTPSSSTANGLTFSPGTSSANSGTGANLTLNGGAASGTGSTGGNVNIDAGTGTSTNGAVNIATNNSANVNVGSTSGTGIITVGQSVGTNTISIGNANTTAGNIQTINVGNGTDVGTGYSSINIGNTNGASAATIYGGTGGVALQAGSSDGINIGTTNPNTITIGSTNSSTSVAIQGGTVSIASSNGTNSTTFGFTGTQIAGNITYQLNRAATAGTYLICTQAATCSVGTGGTDYYLQQVPSSNSANSDGANTISPTGNGINALNVNGTTGTAATAFQVTQTGNAVAAIINDNNLSDALDVNLKNASSSATNGLVINRNASGGTTTNGLVIQDTAGTLSNGLSFSGTIGTDISRSSGTLSLQGTGGISLTAGTTSAITIDSAGAGAVNLGNANAATVTVGNTSQTGATSIYGGSGGIALQTAGTLAITSSKFGLSASGVVTLQGGQTQDITTTASTSANGITIQPGSSSANSGMGASLTFTAGNESGSSSTGGSINIDAGTGTGNNGSINIGTVNAKTIQIGVPTGTTATQTIGIGNDNTSGTNNTVTIGSSIGSSTTTIQAGGGGINLTQNTVVNSKELEVNNTSDLQAFYVTNGTTNLLTADTTDNRVIIGSTTLCTTAKFCVAQTNTNSTGGTTFTTNNNVSTLGAGVGNNSTLIAQNYTVNDTSTATGNALEGIILNTSATTNASTTITSIQANTVAANGGYLLQLEGGGANEFTVSNSGSTFIQPSTNASSLVVDQNSSGSFGTDIFDIKGSSGGTNNFIQVTSTAANAGAVNVSALGTGNGVNIQAGSTGTINIGNSGVANTIQIGTTTGGVAQTIGIGNNATTSSTDTVTIGNTLGSSTTTLQAGSGGINLTQNTVVNSKELEVLDSGDTQAFYVSNGSSNLLTVNTTNSRVTVGSPSQCSTGKFCTVQNINSGGGGTSTTNNNISTIQTGAANNTTLVAQSYTINDTSSSNTGDALEGIILNTSATTNSSTTITSIQANTVAANSGYLLQLEGGGANEFTVSNSGATLIQPSTNTPSAFVVNNNGSSPVLTVDTNANQVIIGSGTTGESTPKLFILDSETGSGSDPTGVNGAMYYNATLNSFRCYENGAWNDCVGVNADNQRQRPFMSTDFLSPNSVTPWGFGAINGTGANVFHAASTADHPGVVTYGSAGCTSTPCGYEVTNMPTAGSTSYSSITIGGGEAFEFVFNPQAFDANTVTHVGFIDNNTGAVPTNGIYFSLDNATLTGKTASGGTISTTGTSATLSTSTWYRVRLVVNSNATSVTYYLFNSSGTQLWSDTLSTNIPTTGTGSGFTTTYATATNKVILNVDYMAMWYGTRSLNR